MIKASAGRLKYVDLEDVALSVQVGCFFYLKAWMSAPVTD